MLGFETLESDALLLSDSSESPCCLNALFDSLDPTIDRSPRPPVLPFIPAVDDIRTLDAFNETRPSASSKKP